MGNDIGDKILGDDTNDLLSGSWPVELRPMLGKQLLVWVDDPGKDKACAINIWCEETNVISNSVTAIAAIE